MDQSQPPAALGREAIRAYIDETAALGPVHARSLAREQWDRIEAAAAGLDRVAADTAPAEGEWSVRQVLEHMLLSLRRNHERLDALYSHGSYTGPIQQPGQLPDDAPSDFDELRRAFSAEASWLTDFLGRAHPARNLQATAGHAAFGEMNWLQWAAYLHVHARDHANQIEAARGRLRT